MRAREGGSKTGKTNVGEKKRERRLGVGGVEIKGRKRLKE